MGNAGSLNTVKKILIQESHQPLSAFSQLEKLFMILMQETADGGIVISLFALYKSGQVINVYIDENKMNTVAAENPPANADNK